MLKFHNYDIVFQEIPDELTLAVNLTGCPCHCPGCHSPHLWEDTGTELDAETLRAIHAEYAGEVTCICLMGGDADPAAIERLCAFVKQEMGLRSAWWSGRPELPEGIDRQDRPLRRSAGRSQVAQDQPAPLSRHGRHARRHHRPFLEITIQSPFSV